MVSRGPAAGVWHFSHVSCSIGQIRAALVPSPSLSCPIMVTAMRAILLTYQCPSLRFRPGQANANFRCNAVPWSSAYAPLIRRLKSTVSAAPSSPSSSQSVSSIIPKLTWVDRMPLRMRPYLHLTRIDKPIGTMLLFYPCGE